MHKVGMFRVCLSLKQHSTNDKSVRSEFLKVENRLRRREVCADIWQETAASIVMGADRWIARNVRVFILQHKSFKIHKWAYVEVPDSLECYAVSTGKNLPRLRTSIAPSTSMSSTLSSSWMSVTMWRFSQRYWWRFKVFFVMLHRTDVSVLHSKIK